MINFLLILSLGEPSYDEAAAFGDKSLGVTPPIGYCWTLVSDADLEEIRESVSLCVINEEV